MPRPLKPIEDRMVPCSVSLDPERRAKFVALGGSKWLREQIDAARTPRPAANEFAAAVPLVGSDA